MESVRIVATGDNHLSASLPRLTPLRRAERRARLRAGFEAAVTYAIEHEAHLFIQAGDLFDTAAPSNQDRAFVAAALARLRRAGVICVGIGGNHDSPRMTTEQGGESPQHSYAALEGLHYFSRHDVLVPQLFNVNGVQMAVAGLSNNPVAQPGSDPLAGMHLEDQDRLLAQADMALLILHAGIEGLCQPHEGERIVSRASIAALPAAFRLIVAGHIHRFGRERFDGRTAVVCGATERMEFGAADGSSGFAWIEVNSQNEVQVEHSRVPEQPRADLMISTGELWPPQERTVLPDALELPEADVAGPLWQVVSKQTDPLAVIQRRLAAVATPETIVRLKLVGPLSPEQYHQLVLRAILAAGQRQCFSFDLDTSGLIVQNDIAARVGALAHAGPISPLREAETVLAERLEGVAVGDTIRISDERAAAELLMARLRTIVDQETGQ